MVRHAWFLASWLIVSTAALAQTPPIEFPAASPACTLKQRIGLTDVEITYSRPSAKGRTMLGHIDPYGEVWRTGANSATRILFSSEVKLNGTPVPAGTYGLFTIPDPAEWTIILSKVSKQWGAYTYNPKDDVVRFKAKAVALSEHVETFTIEFSDFGVDSATLNLVWEKTRVPVELKADFIPKVVAQIDAAMAAEGKKPYYSAALFYLNYGLDAKRALGWLDAASAEKPNVFNIITWRARALAKTGDRKGAIAEAKHAIELAKAAPEPAGSEYVRLNEELLAQLAP
jgi:hypothetical protein